MDFRAISKTLSLLVVCFLLPAIVFGENDNIPSNPAGDEQITTGVLVPDTCDDQYPGDANADDTLDFRDMSYIAAYVCGGGPAPTIAANGDPNGDCIIDTADVIYLFQYLVYNGPAPVVCTCVEPALGECSFAGDCDCLPGDANGDAVLNVGDAVYNLKPVLKGGPVPVPYFPCSGDANGGCLNNIVDSYFIIRYVFKGGQPPPNCYAWRIICGPYE
jgi:hypothetical protein